MRILALDYGKVRIGVAVSDPLSITAQPLAVIQNDRDLISKISQLLDKYQTKKILLGLPKTLKGELKESAAQVLEFQEELKQKLGAEVEIWDERLTTAQAEKTLLSANLSRAKRKKVIDKLAAAYILQGYLDRIKNSPSRGL